MNAVWNAIGRAVTWAAFGPIDRTVCRWAEVTHHARQP